MKKLQEVTIVSGRDREILAEIKAIISCWVPDADVLVYGSVARGTNGPDSDYDMLILADNPVDVQVEELIRDRLYDFQLQHDVLVCCVFRTRAQWDAPRMQVSPFHKEVERDGILI